MPESLSIEEIRQSSVPAKIMIDLQMCVKFEEEYSRFVKLVEEALDFSIHMMVPQKNVLAGLDEDKLTTFLLAPIKSMGFSANHDTNVGGHCDISIFGTANMMWLGEAKIHSSYDKTLGGFQQLLDRYSTGLPDQDSGGVIIYHDKENTKAMMDNWRDYLEQYDPDCTVSVLPNRPLEFRSVHTHKGSGLDFNVRHTPVVLYHQPTDDKPRPKRKAKKASSSPSG